MKFFLSVPIQMNEQFNLCFVSDSYFMKTLDRYRLLKQQISNGIDRHDTK